MMNFTNLASDSIGMDVLLLSWSGQVQWTSAEFVEPFTLGKSSEHSVFSGAIVLTTYALGTRQMSAAL
jgi:hypothetical protein